MDKVLEIFNLVYGNLPALIGMLTGIIGVALIIPGEQPEKFLQGIVKFLSKFSKK